MGAYERRFRRAGLPLFIEDFRASTDVFNRAVPLLGLVFLGETLNALNLEWSPLANLAAVAGALAILLVAVGIANRARGRPFRSVPRTVGRVELALFVLVPALLPLIFGGQWRSSLVIAAVNLFLLALIYATLGLGLAAILRWVAGRLVSQLRGSLDADRPRGPSARDLRAALVHQPGDVADLLLGQRRDLLDDPRPLRRPRHRVPRGADPA